MAQTDSTSPKPFRVIIIGAGNVGLSLSHALQLANIEHVVLEKHDKIVSIRGAALSIWPSVARIFDQFGLLANITNTTTPITRECQRWPDGSLSWCGDMMQSMGNLFKIPVILFDRQACVSHLYNGLPDKSKIQTSKRLERIEHTETGVRIHLADGSMEEGDMVVGADGVHSLVRKLMWDYAAEHEPGSIPEADKEVMSFGEFRGLFGVSTLPDSTSLGPADTHVIFGQDEAKLLFTQPGKAYWGISFKDDFRKSEQKSRVTEADMEAVAKRFADRPMTENVKLGDLWKTSTRHGLFAIEEGVLSKWHAGRIVLVGDSAHKMTADLGMGANIAIESAIYLANILYREFGSRPARRISTPDLNALFAEYQAARHERASKYVALSGNVTRAHSYQTYFGRFFSGYLAQYMAPMHKKALAKSLALAPKLSYVPTRTIDEGAEGWQLALAAKDDPRGWLVYVVLTSIVGVIAAYCVRTGLSVRV